MRKPIMGAAAAATLALGATAVAASGDSEEPVSVGTFSGDPARDFAQDLADELGGEVSAEQVEDALEAVAEEHADERRTAMAEGIAEHLDGVTVDQVADALAVVDERMRQAFEAGEPPDPSLFTEVLAEELGLREDEVSSALEDVRKEQFDALPELHREGLDELRHRGEALPVPPGGLGGRPHLEFAFPAPPS